MLYTTFWQRVGASLLDLVCFVPILVLYLLVWSLGRHFYVACTVLQVLVNIGFYVLLVQRYGGTPGKLMMGLRIVKTDGSPVGYREAFLRNVVPLSLSVLAGLALVMGTLSMTDAEYLSLGWQQRLTAQISLAPEWNAGVSALSHLWNLSLLVVMLANNKRRATHDFVAGTVVVKQARSQELASDDVSAQMSL
ncbi:RDD family protein [Dyella soli]|uniref:RDD family protein n=1 Tax=Dyella soli TaxID=522319 RepID=UPI0013F3DE56|nr:RDD family protein [Dyella soli]